MNHNKLLVTKRYSELLHRFGHISPADVTHIQNEETAKIMNVVATHLCQGDFAAAIAISRRFNTTFPKKISWFYVYEGIGLWFSNDKARAIDRWETAAKCGFTYARGLEVALLMYYASIRDAKSMDPAVAAKRLKSSLSSNPYGMPELIASGRLLLGEVSIDEARLLSEAFEKGRMPQSRVAFEFYAGVYYAQQNDSDNFWKKMAYCANEERCTAVIQEIVLSRIEVNTNLPKRSRRQSKNVK